MTDLPKLKIGCGIKFKQKKEDVHYFVCGLSSSWHDNETLEIYYCPTCQHNLDAVKKNAAAHQKEVMRWKEGTRTEENALAARDAVLGLLSEELKEKEGENK